MNMTPEPIQNDGKSHPDQIDFDFMRLVVRVIRGYRVIFAFALAGCLVGLLFCAVLKKSYTAEALFLPPVSADAIQATSLLLRQDPSDLYLGMLSSSSVADSVIDANHLMDVYHARYRIDARAQLAHQSTFSVERNALISVSVTTGDPILSTHIANSYLDALYKVKGEMSASSSAHRSSFFEDQLSSERESLADAESQLALMEKNSGIVLPEGEAEAGLTETARLQEAVQQDEAQLSSLLTGSTEQNPEVVRLRAQISALRSQLREQQTSQKASLGNGLTSTANMPGVMLDYLRKSRDLKLRETLYESLTEQYEKAHLAALDPGPQLEVVDRATTPERKSGPPRTLIFVAATFLGALLGLISIILTPSLGRMVQRYRALSADLDRR